MVTDAKGRRIGQGRNRIWDRAYQRGTEAYAVVANHDLAHAEVNALLSLRYVYENEGEDDNPHGWSLYTTMEPCPACLGMFYMSGLRALHYAARDPYSGSVNLLGATPYLSRKPVRVNGPHAALESLSVALTVEWAMQKDTADRSRFARDLMRPTLPAGVGLAERLFERGVLQELRERGVSAEEMVERLVGELEDES